MVTVFYPNDQDVVSKVIEGEAILINLKTGIYYSMNETGGMTWSSLTHGASIEQISEFMVNHCQGTGETVGSDIQAFIDLLVDEALVVSSEIEYTSEIPALEFDKPAEYKMPSMEKFDDMAEMFALDPPLPSLVDQQ